MWLDDSNPSNYNRAQLDILQGRAKDDLSADELLAFANAAPRLLAGPEPGDFRLDTQAIAEFSPLKRMEAVDAGRRITNGRREIRRLQEELPFATPDRQQAVNRRLDQIKKELRADWIEWGHLDLSASSG